MERQGSVHSTGCQLRQTILEDESDRDPRNPATLTTNPNICPAGPSVSKPGVFLILDTDAANKSHEGE
jgi:hypothetical protein